MANNDQINVSDWVDRRLAELTPSVDWPPDTENAFIRLREKDRAHKSRRIKMTAIGLATVCAIVVALPRAKRKAEHLWIDAPIVNIGQVFADEVALKNGQAAPDFVLQDASGADLRLSAYKGKVVLLNFWATWCHGCTMEIPWLLQFQKAYKDRGFTVIGVSMDDDGWKSVRPFIAEDKISYPVVIGNDQMAKPYGLEAMPMTFLISRDGKITATSVGIIDRAACERQIRELLDARN